MIYVYRFGLGRWALLCVLFTAGAMLAFQRFPDGFDPNILPPPSAGIPLQQSEASLPCKNMIYSISQDGVHYVHDAGGGTVFAARLNQQVGFYQLNPYGYMMPTDQATLDIEAAGRLTRALLQCQSPWLPSGTWFNLSAQSEPASAMN